MMLASLKYQMPRISTRTKSSVRLNFYFVLSIEFFVSLFFVQHSSGVYKCTGGISVEPGRNPASPDVLSTMVHTVPMIVHTPGVAPSAPSINKVVAREPLIPPLTLPGIAGSQIHSLSPASRSSPQHYPLDENPSFPALPALSIPSAKSVLRGDGARSRSQSNVSEHTSSGRMPLPATSSESLHVGFHHSESNAEVAEPVGLPKLLREKEQCVFLCHFVTHYH